MNTVWWIVLGAVISWLFVGALSLKIFIVLMGWQKHEFAKRDIKIGIAMGWVMAVIALIFFVGGSIKKIICLIAAAVKVFSRAAKIVWHGGGIMTALYYLAGYPE